MGSIPAWQGDNLAKMEGKSLGEEILEELEVWRRCIEKLEGLLER